MVHCTFPAGVRLFVARQSSGSEPSMMGFALLDPMHRNGVVVGYYANIVRTRRNVHPGTAGLLIQVRQGRAMAPLASNTSSFGLFFFQLPPLPPFPIRRH